MTREIIIHHFFRYYFQVSSLVKSENGRGIDNTYRLRNKKQRQRQRQQQKQQQQQQQQQQHTP